MAIFLLLQLKCSRKLARWFYQVLISIRGHSREFAVRTPL